MGGGRKQTTPGSRHSRASHTPIRVIRIGRSTSLSRTLRSPALVLFPFINTSRQCKRKLRIGGGGTRHTFACRAAMAHPDVPGQTRSRARRPAGLRKRQDRGDVSGTTHTGVRKDGCARTDAVLITSEGPVADGFACDTGAQGLHASEKEGRKRDCSPKERGGRVSA